MVRLNYNIQGDGEPLLILHGLFGSARNWSGIARRLGEVYRVIAVDMRNHGGSGHADAMSYADMVDDLYGLLQELELDTAYFLGHSMGGKAAMGFALTHPGKTAGLIVVDIAPVSYRTDHLPFLDAMQSLPLAELAGREDAAARLQAAGVTDDVIRQFLLQNLVRRDGGYAWRLNLQALRQHMDDLASFPQDWPHASYTGPAGFLAGDASNYVRPEYYPEIRRLFPAATIKTLENAGHWVHADQPEAFITAVREFMREARMSEE
jgi:esterase